MSLADIVAVNVSSDSVGVAQAGFGVPIILSANATFAERVHAYTNPSDLSIDGFQPQSPEYRAAQALMSQRPKPKKFLVGRLTNKPTQAYTITIKTVANTTRYAFFIKSNGGTDVEVAYTSDGSATNDEIVTGLKAAFDALSVAGFTATTPGTTGATTLVITGNAAGNWLGAGVKVENAGKLWIAQTHADPGVVADLTAIRNEDDTFYSVINLYNSKAMVLALAAEVETLKKIFVVASGDTEIIGASAGSASDVAKSLATSSYARSAVIFNADGFGDFPDAAWLGRCLPLDPGSETWKFKTLVGIGPDALTATQIQNAQNKFCNIYTVIAGVSITSEGVVAANEYIDVIRGNDWNAARIAERIFGKLASRNKVPFTDAGIKIVENEVRSQLKEGVTVGLFSDDPAPEVFVPKAADVNPSDKQQRKLTGIKFTATLAGAIHSLTVAGSVSV